MFYLSNEDKQLLQDIMHSISSENITNEIKENVKGCNGGCGYSCSVNKG